MERVPRPLDESDRVLLIRLGAIGDVLRTLPALRQVRRTFPAIHLTWIVEDLSRDLLLDHPDIDEVIRFPRRELRQAAARPWRLGAGLAGLRRELRRRHFSVSIDAQGSFKSALVALLSGASRRIGFAPGHCREASFLLTNEWVRLPSPWLNRVEKNLKLVEALGATGDEVSIQLPERPEEGREAESILNRLVPEGKPVVLLSPGTSRLQDYKRWPTGHYARLARLILRSLDVVPLVVWGPGEEALAAAVVDRSGEEARMAPLVGLRLLAALLRRVAAFVGADTGPMHLAWCVGCPVVALFGPTDPRLNAPLGPDHVVLRGENSIVTITPEAVSAALGHLIARPSRGRPNGPPRLSRASLGSGTTEPLR